MTSKEFTEWMAYDRVSPIGNERIELMIGLAISELVNALCGAKKSPIDYMPFINAEKHKEPQTIEEQMRIVDRAGR